MPKQIFIHAGSHRAGSSSFQLCLSQNRARLEGRGYDLLYPGRDGAPGGTLRLRLPYPRHKPKTVRAFAAHSAATLRDASPDPDRALILSEENIPGRMLHFFQGRFFPAADMRLAALAGALAAPPVHLLYVVRSYADLYLSSYRKRASDHPVRPFRELVPDLMRMDRGWPELMAAFQSGLTPARLTVVDYAHRGTSRDLLSRLIGEVPAADLAEPARVVNRSPSDAALGALQTRLRAGEELDQAARADILDRHGGDTADHGFARFTEDERATLDARYARDLDRLAAMPGITFGADDRRQAG